MKNQLLALETKSGEYVLDDGTELDLPKNEYWGVQFIRRKPNLISDEEVDSINKFLSTLSFSSYEEAIAWVKLSNKHLPKNKTNLGLFSVRVRLRS